MESQIREMLAMGVESSLPPAAYAALGASGTRALISVFERTDAPRHVRLRALGVLSALDDERASEYLARLVELRSSAQMEGLGNLHPLRSPSVLRRALQGLTRHPGKVDASRVMPHLAHRDATVRAAAVRLLASKPEPSVTRALMGQRERERSREVLGALEIALKDRSALPASPPPDAPGSGSPPR
ncbi:MAG: hypothetical protein QM778_13910 [Myxococcales bacterium]